MPETLKILGQTAAAAETALYTVPASTQTIVSTITACNQTTSNLTFRIAVCPGGAATAVQNYIYYDANLGASTTVAITIGITMGAADVIRTSHSGAIGNVSFNAFGTEIS